MNRVEIHNTPIEGRVSVVMKFSGEQEKTRTIDFVYDSNIYCGIKNIIISHFFSKYNRNSNIRVEVRIAGNDFNSIVEIYHCGHLIEKIHFNIHDLRAQNYTVKTENLILEINHGDYDGYKLTIKDSVGNIMEMLNCLEDVSNLQIEHFIRDYLYRQYKNNPRTYAVPHINQNSSIVEIYSEQEKIRQVYFDIVDNREAAKEFREETKKKENADMTEPLVMYVEVYNEPLSLHDDAFQVWIKDQECNPLSHSIEQDTNIGMAAREAVRDHMKHLYNQREHDVVTKLENDSVCSTIYFNGEIQHIFYLNIYDKTSKNPFKNQFKNIEIGDRVWSLKRGWGTVYFIDRTTDPFPIEVKFDDKNPHHQLYDMNGYVPINNILIPELYWDELEIDPPKPKR